MIELPYLWRQTQIHLLLSQAAVPLEIATMSTGLYDIGPIKIPSVAAPMLLAPSATLKKFEMALMAFSLTTNRPKANNAFPDSNVI